MILVLTNHSRDGALITGRPKPAMVAIRAVSRDGATATGYEVGEDGATIGGEVESGGGTHQIGVADTTTPGG